MSRVNKTMQINYYLTGKVDPHIVLITGEYNDEFHAEMWEDFLQKIIRTHQRLHQENDKLATVEIIPNSRPIPRSNPPKQVSYEDYPDLDELLGLDALVA